MATASLFKNGKNQAVNAATLMKQSLQSTVPPIGQNDTLIAGRCISVEAILVTDHIREFKRVEHLTIEY